jgi:hypothetical protein
LREAHPDIELVLTTGTTQEIAARTIANTADLGLTSLPVHDGKFAVTRVRTDERVSVWHGSLRGFLNRLISPQSH